MYIYLHTNTFMQPPHPPEGVIAAQLFKRPVPIGNKAALTCAGLHYLALRLATPFSQDPKQR